MGCNEIFYGSLNSGKPFCRKHYFLEVESQKLSSKKKYYCFECQKSFIEDKCPICGYMSKLNQSVNRRDKNKSDYNNAILIDNDFEYSRNNFISMRKIVNSPKSTTEKLKKVAKAFYSELEDCNISSEEMFHATYTRDKLNEYHNFDYSESNFPLIMKIHEALNDEDRVGRDVKKMADYWSDFYSVEYD